MGLQLEKADDTIKAYYKILSDDMPEFLHEYSKVPEMQRIGAIGLNCGTDYTDIFQNKYFYSRLEHSIGVALIIWNFTKDKEQTLAGLFHDIATPSFSHCIDYLHKDYMKQETTECRTRDIIVQSSHIMELLSKDKILVDDVCDYKKYPIADNSSPQLSADRLEYTLSSGMTFTKEWSIHDVADMYRDLIVLNNEEGDPEIAFKSQKTAEKFVGGASKMWSLFQSNEDKIVMQFFADIIAYVMNCGIIEEEDLYRYSELEIIRLIENCGVKEIQDAFFHFRNATHICEGDFPPLGRYSVSIDVKKRYINPLVMQTRLDIKSEKAKKIIYDSLHINKPPYAWFGFDLGADIFSLV